MNLMDSDSLTAASPCCSSGTERESSAAMFNTGAQPACAAESCRAGSPTV